ncbi:MAG: hypothetical protein Q4F40_10745, partial [Akkermansia sp.]|nr:hypothetical protein [Akkermansia sp.]
PKSKETDEKPDGAKGAPNGLEQNPPCIRTKHGYYIEYRHEGVMQVPIPNAAGARATHGNT